MGRVCIGRLVGCMGLVGCVSGCVNGCLIGCMAGFIGCPNFLILGSSAFWGITGKEGFATDGTLCPSTTGGCGGLAILGNATSVLAFLI